MSRERRSRRRFVRRLAGLCFGAAALPLVGCGAAAPPARTARVARIGYLDPGAAPPPELEAFRDELQGLGYVGDRNLVLVDRYANGATDRLGGLAAELLERGVDVLVAFGTQATQAAMTATEQAQPERAPIDRTPIVIASSSDPVGSGLVDSLDRPGKNVTGLTSLAPQLTGKRLQLLKEAVPSVSSVAFLWDPTSPGDRKEEDEIRRAAGALGLGLVALGVTTTAEFPAAFRGAVDRRADALVTFASGLINRQAPEIVRFAAERRLPGMYATREFVAVDGGLMAYGPNYGDMYRRAAVYVDKLLNGARPGDLPVEKARRFSLVINRRAAQELGLTIPRSLLVQADEVVDRVV